MSDEEVDFHPIEVAAHSVLSSSLDSLQEKFQNLHKSQHILLTRLKSIEDRLVSVQKQNGASITELDVSAVHKRIKTVQQQLAKCEKTLAAIDQRVTSTT